MTSTMPRWTRRPPFSRRSRSPAAAARPEILRQLKPDPARDDLRELMAGSGPFSTTPETVACLIRFGEYSKTGRPRSAAARMAAPRAAPRIIAVL